MAQQSICKSRHDRLQLNDGLRHVQAEGKGMEQTLQPEAQKVIFFSEKKLLALIVCLKGSFTIFLFSVRTHILDSNEVWYS